MLLMGCTRGDVSAMIRSVTMTLFVSLFFIVAISAQDNPVFEPNRCRFTLPTGFDVTCGYINVPESRNPAIADDSNEIRIPVALVHSLSENPLPDPVIYLNGGPGGYTLTGISDLSLEGFAPFLQNRDLILFDQRGVGFSIPNLDCPALQSIGYYALDKNLSYKDETELTNNAFFTCRDELIAGGANLNAYTTLENAADVRDIVTALGYEQVNLFGISYGTRLGLVVMRDYPDIIRSAVLDAVYPPLVDSKAEFLPNMLRAFDALFAACVADEACDKTYPDLKTVFYDTVDRLNASPETVSFVDQYSQMRQRNILVDGKLLIDTLFGMLYQTPTIPNLPRYIYEASAGNYDSFVDRLMFQLFMGISFSEAMHQSVQCYEDVNFSSREKILTKMEGLPAQIRFYYVANNVNFADDSLEFCNIWTDGQHADMREDEAVFSTVPTLLTVGQFDPITPPSWAHLAAETLTNSVVYEFPSVGHPAWGSGDCPNSMIVRFINDPFSELDAGCISEMPSPQFVP